MEWRLKLKLNTPGVDPSLITYRIYLILKLVGYYSDKEKPINAKKARGGAEEENHKI